MGLTNCNTKYGYHQLLEYKSHIILIIILRLLQDVYNHLTTLQQGRKRSLISLYGFPSLKQK